MEEVFIFVPMAVVKDQYFTPYLHVPLAHRRKKLTRNILALSQNPMVIIPARPITVVHDKHIKSNALPFYFKPAVLDPIHGFLFRVCCSRCLTHSTHNYAAHMESRDNMMPIHHSGF